MTAAPLGSASGASRSLDLYRIGLALVALYFAARLVFLAVSLHPFVPPDEVDWFGRATHFARTLGIPADSAESARFGLIAHQPNLYFWLLGRVLALHPEPEQALVLARLANLPFALIALYYTARLAGLFVSSRIAKLAILVAATNTLQVTHLYATVTYDNLSNALAVALFYYLFSLFDRFEPKRFFAFVLCAALGCLTKSTMLPIAVLAVLSLVYRRRRSLAGELRASASALGRAPWSIAAVGLVAAAACGATLVLYGGNLARFGKLQPGALDVLPLDQALEHRIVRRDWVVDQYRRGLLSEEQAEAEIARIPNRGNRGRAQRLIASLRAAGGAPPRIAPVWEYLPFWAVLMRDRLFGFQGNGSFHFPPMPALRASVLPLAGMTLVALLIRGRRATGEAIAWHAAGIALAYGAILVALVHYPLYRQFGAIDYAVNGRYLIGVLPLAYVLGGRYLLEPLPRRFRLFAGIAIAALFVASDVPYLFDHMSACWFVDPPVAAKCVY